MKSVNGNFIPVKLHIKEQPQSFKRFGALWTPTGIILDADGKEHHRFEGFLPVEDFLAQLEFGLGKTAFAHEDYPEAEKRFRGIVEKYRDTDAAPEALYWAGVSKYKSTNDPKALEETGQQFRSRYTHSTWAKKASVWVEEVPRAAPGS